MARYVFGPVASRRLGRSLGVDLTRHKYCSLDCIYCEVGATNHLGNSPAVLVDVDEVMRQLDEVLSKGPEIDFVTFSGSGEPTLNARIGEVVTFIKTKYPQYPLCLLTNATRFNDAALRRAILPVDVVVPSLDASNAEEFKIINRPGEDVCFEELVEGMEAFAREYRGHLWLELFVVPGVNDSEESIQRFAELLRRIGPERVQLNTLDRPGVLDWVKTASRPTLERFIHGLEPIVPVEAVGRFRYRTREAGGTSLSLDEEMNRILDLASRRPITVADATVALNLDEEKAAGVMEKMLHSGLLCSERLERGVFYSVPQENKE